MLLLSLACFTATRLFLLLLSLPDAELTPLVTLRIFATGLVYDLAFYAYALVPFVLYLLLCPNRFWRSRVNRWLVHLIAFATVYGLGYIATAEWLFWQEFGVRFNFISVDYLVYRKEVTENIVQSYPLPLYLSVILAVTLVVYAWLGRRIDRLFRSVEPFRRRLAYASAWLLLSLPAYVLVDQDLRSFSSNRYQRELAGNGPYQFFNAFRDNELDYYDFYYTLPDAEAWALLKREIGGIPPENGLFDIRRAVDNPGTEQRLNVFLIMVESLSADFLDSLGGDKGLTPFLDRLAERSLVFDRFYATGTRTTRGLEAVTLSIPPTPGRSIVKRLGRESGFWSLGNVLGEKGYDVRFLYGGRAYFDNMGAFFSGNGYRVMDQSSIPDGEILFENAWGISDEDLYRQALKAADQAHADGRPFFFHLMTTSNHRPYTYPEGRVDIPPGTNREGAVKYTDWALGDLLAKVEKKPWFDDTLFVIVADHYAGSAGMVDLPLREYRIPLFIYAPSRLAPRRISTLASQIDLAPTLLGLLNMDYRSAFFGRDILRMPAGRGRALIGNYQRLGLYDGRQMSILKPKRELARQLDPEKRRPTIVELQRPDAEMKRDIAYYQGASYIYKHRLNAWPGAGDSGGD
ncbi:MAG TPA: alkaline phosphatase family protein [Sedimenticola thiotaurini]|uniref:Alkaline phosphatase family protein n=1 Tax=Sedimenticola thiotaurini TaxID=1543721 RepID=A0A831RR34_9GAMM|nr:alkaline phosphatase family protein [Sedimenticola thiotaurini]